MTNNNNNNQDEKYEIKMARNGPNGCMPLVLGVCINISVLQDSQLVFTFNYLTINNNRPIL